MKKRRRKRRKKVKRGRREGLNMSLKLWRELTQLFRNFGIGKLPKR